MADGNYIVMCVMCINDKMHALWRNGIRDRDGNPSLHLGSELQPVLKMNELPALVSMDMNKWMNVLKIIQIWINITQSFQIQIENNKIVDSRLCPQSCWHKGCKWKQEILYIVTNLINRGHWAQLSRVIHAGGTHMWTHRAPRFPDHFLDWFPPVHRKVQCRWPPTAEAGPLSVCVTCARWDQSATTPDILR